MMRNAVFALLLVMNAAAAFAAQPIGRLFFTPEERAQLDAARAAKRVAEPAATAAKPDTPPPPQTQVITYSGIVRRSDGKSILWLNNHAADEKEALSGLPVSGRVRPDGGVTLQVPGGGGTIDLRVGQRAELQTGRVAEGRAPEKSEAAKSDDADKAAKADVAKGDSKGEKEPPKSDAKAAPSKAAEADRKSEPAASRSTETSSRPPGK